MSDNTKGKDARLERLAAQFAADLGIEGVNEGTLIRDLVDSSSAGAVEGIFMEVLGDVPGMDVMLNGTVGMALKCIPAAADDDTGEYLAGGGGGEPLMRVDELTKTVRAHIAVRTGRPYNGRSTVTKTPGWDDAVAFLRIRYEIRPRLRLDHQPRWGEVVRWVVKHATTGR